MVLRGLAEAVRTRRVSSRELVGLALGRIEKHDAELNAVTALRGDEALAEAAALDERVADREDPGPLAGIPFLVKDIEDLTGLPTTNGSLLCRDAPAARTDGLIASRLRAAGAIPIGKTNTPEYACQGFTANRLVGITRNPWAPGWSPGGSSGGSGAAIAAGYAPIATATDTGGSVRIPAACCGLVGLKPTNGIVARDLRLWWPDLTTSGPLGVSVDDVRLLLGVEAGPVAGDPAVHPTWRPQPGMPRRVLAAPRFHPWGPLSPEVERAFDEALSRLERDLDLAVEPVDPARLHPSGNPDLDWPLICAPELVAWIGRGTVLASLDLFHPSTRSFLEFGLRQSVDDYLDARMRRFGYTRELDELLGYGAVLASPTMAEGGILADGHLPGSDAPEPPTHVYNTNVHNLAGHPAISVPAGVLPNGVPFGLQFTGPRFRDGMLLDLAEAWERANPWPHEAPGYEPFGV